MWINQIPIKFRAKYLYPPDTVLLANNNYMFKGCSKLKSQMILTRSSLLFCFLNYSYAFVPIIETLFATILVNGKFTMKHLQNHWNIVFPSLVFHFWRFSKLVWKIQELKEGNKWIIHQCQRSFHLGQYSAYWNHLQDGAAQWQVG